MHSACDDPQRAGLPHSEILGSQLNSSSPRLIAGIHVLHRLLTPRHPPCALDGFITPTGNRFHDHRSTRHHRVNEFTISISHPAAGWLTIFKPRHIALGWIGRQSFARNTAFGATGIKPSDDPPLLTYVIVSGCQRATPAATCIVTHAPAQNAPKGFLFGTPFFKGRGV